MVKDTRWYATKEKWNKRADDYDTFTGKRLKGAIDYIVIAKFLTEANAQAYRDRHRSDKIDVFAVAYYDDLEIGRALERIPYGPSGDYDFLYPSDTGSVARK